jgi:hypothetical protein
MVGRQPQHRNRRGLGRVPEESPIGIGHAPLRHPFPDKLDHPRHRLRMPPGIHHGVSEAYGLAGRLDEAMQQAQQALDLSRKH